MLRGWRRRKKTYADISPDEILIDSSNLPEFDRDQFEGRIERPLSTRALSVAGVCLALLFVALLGRASDLQLVQGAAYAKQARENQLSQTTVFADRGLIVDRTGRELVWNDREHVTDDYATRVYTQVPGVAHVLGYVKEPAKDSSGNYYRDSFAGVDGVELVFNQTLGGSNGLKLTETDARGDVVAEAVVEPPHTGEKLTLSIDAVVSELLYKAIAGRATDSRFQGGAGVVMDVHTGELLALVSYPEYSPTALMEGDKDAIAALNADKRRPFLNRATDGLYAPGSIVKPVVGVAILEENIINPQKQIYSAGQISIPNPYNPDKPSIFKDWKAHGWVDLRRAIAVSSDIYFYAVSGGFQDQKGLGIRLLDEYYKLFGFGVEAGLAGFSSALGNIPTPEWKEATFDGDPWRLGDTYNTSIGQYGMQLTPLQAARAAAALATGKLLVPQIVASSTPRGQDLGISPQNLKIVQEGMRMSVTEGIAGAVNLPYVAVAAKTGTAQVGVRNEYINSWMIGFWPYENPRYAYAVVLERGPASTLVGTSAAVGDFFRAMHEQTPQYLH